MAAKQGLLLLLATSALLVLVSGQAAPTRRQFFFGTGGYFPVSAINFCQNNGGVIASIRNDNESLTVRLRQTGGGIFVGLRRQTLSTPYTWVDGWTGSSTASQWNQGEPGGDEYIAAFWNKINLEDFCRTYGASDNAWWNNFNVACTINTCPPNQYLSGGQCLPYSICTNSFRVPGTQGTASSLMCVDAAFNPNVFSGACLYTSDAPCTAWSTCSSTTQYQISAPTTSSDRICGNLSPCPAGFFQLVAATPTTDRTCSACAAGTADTDSNVLTPCATCPEGTFQPNTGVTSCPLCAAGTIDHDANALTACTQCPVGTYTAAGSSRVCTQCGLGNSDTDNNPATPCVLCGAGTFVPVGSAGSCNNFVCPTGSVDHDSSPTTPCVTCGAGTAVTQTGRTGPCSNYLCPAGTIDNDSDPKTACVTCAAGAYVPPGQSGLCSAFRCLAGTSDTDSNSSTPCETCPIGTFAAAGSVGPCVPCAAGTIDHDFNSSTPCVACPVGTSSVAGQAGTCALCPAGTTDHDNLSSTACIACGAGTYTPAGSAGPCSLYLCPLGTTDDDSRASTVCITCNAGTFLSSAGLAGPCSNFFCSVGFTDQDLNPLTPCTLCGPGNFLPVGSSGPCSNFACQAGFVDNDNSATTPCISCAAGTYTPAGSFGTCGACAAGTTDHDSSASTPCVACNAGTFIPNSNSFGPCNSFRCPAGTTDDDSNALTACVSCSVGTFAPIGSSGLCASLACPPGWIDADNRSDTACVTCPAGTFSPAGSWGACPLCREGTSDTDLNASTPCAACPLGSYAPVGSTGSCAWCVNGLADIDRNPATPCASCGAGYFAANRSVGPCSDLICPPGTTDHDSNPSTPCLACGAGFQLTIAGLSGACSSFACPLGSTDHDNNATTACIACAPGTFVPAQSAGPCSLFSCPAGWTDLDSNPTTPCVACSAGSFTAAGTSGVCPLCAAGSTDLDRNASTPCVTCAFGTYAAQGTSGECGACASGMVDHDTDPSTPCVSCGTGYFIPARSFGACSLYICAAGTTDHDSNASTPCISCGPGYQALTAGLSLPCSSLACPAGSTDDDNIATTACVACPAGTFSPLAASGPCSSKLCPAGWSDIDSRSDTPCDQCGAGTYTAPGSFGSCPLCPAGFTDRDSNASTPCVPCANGTFTTAGWSGVCPSCNAGSTDDDSNPSTACVVCPPGTYTPAMSNGPCSNFQCSVGSTDVDSSPITPCMVCGLGYAVLLTGRNGSCSTYSCPAGTVGVSTTSSLPCVQCPNGTYTPPASTANTSLPGPLCASFSCPAGSSDTDRDPATPCEGCPAGTFVPRGSAGACDLYLCAVGTADSDQDSSTPCSACVNGTRTVTSGATECLNASVCIPPEWERAPPTATSDRWCSDAVQYCARYDPLTDYRCAECVAGRYGVANASVCAPCPAGARCINGTLGLCARGTYQNASGQTACVACAAGWAVGREGQQRCDACLGPWYAAATGQTGCTAMSSGFFGLPAIGSALVGGSGTGPGTNNNNSNNDNNNNNDMSNNSENAIGYVGQQACPAGSFCINGSRTLCAAGTYQTALAATGCVACGVGMYTPVAGTLIACVRIPGGQYGTGGDSSGTTRTGIAPCAAGSACVNGSATVCGPGTFQAQSGRSACVACPRGSFSNTTGRSTPCDTVQPGYYPVGQGTNGGSLGQVPCEPGSACFGGARTMCPPGQYQNAPGQTSCLGCSFFCSAPGTNPTLVCDSITGVPVCVDDIAPAIYLNGSSAITIEVDEPYRDPGAWAVDTHDGPLTPRITVAPNVNVVGRYVEQYTATDAAGNSASVTRVVVVVDTRPPVLTIRGANPAYTFVGVTYTDAGCVATDRNAAVTVTTVNLPIDSSFAQTVEVVYTARDAVGNTATAIRLVHVLNSVTEQQALKNAMIAYQAAVASGVDPRNASEAAYTAWGGRNNISGVFDNVLTLASQASRSSAGSSSAGGATMIMIVAIIAILAVVVVALFLIYRKHKQYSLVTHHAMRANSILATNANSIYSSPRTSGTIPAAPGGFRPWATSRSFVNLSVPGQTHTLSSQTGSHTLSSNGTMMQPGGYDGALTRPFAYSVFNGSATLRALNGMGVGVVQESDFGPGGALANHSEGVYNVPLAADESHYASNYTDIDTDVQYHIPLEQGPNGALIPPSSSPRRSTSYGFAPYDYVPPAEFDSGMYELAQTENPMYVSTRKNSGYISVSAGRTEDTKALSLEAAAQWLHDNEDQWLRVITPAEAYTTLCQQPPGAFIVTREAGSIFHLNVTRAPGDVWSGLIVLTLEAGVILGQESAPSLSDLLVHLMADPAAATRAGVPTPLVAWDSVSA
eukprot:m.199678 g.199678  ORF g.199678 m.199678 type:complete len:2328 (-) comp15492_c2_seq9:42-7025(-)